VRADATTEPRRSRLRGTRAALVVCAIAMAVGGLGAKGRAQESGGSFGGSSWDEPSGGGGGGGGGGSWGGGSSGTDWAEQQRREDEQRAERERREEEERRRREEEERRRREEEERRRREEEERIARERARKLALPPMERARELDWPATPPRPAVATRGLDAPLAPELPPASSWTAPSPVAPLDLPPTASVAGPFEWSAAACCGVPLFVILLPLAWLLTRERAPWKNVPQPAGAFRAARSSNATARRVPTGPALRVSIAFDWTARAAIQSQLAAMAKRHDMRSRPGLHAAAVEMSALLAQHAAAARYMTWELASGDPRTGVQAPTDRPRAPLQARPRRTTPHQPARAYEAKEHEGQGLVVVSVLVASKVPIVVPPGEITPDALASVLGAIRRLRPDQTLALEVIWSPAAENDRMSSYELEQRYPELQRTSDGVGRMQCSYCGAPFPRELGRCPACGGPAGS